MTQLPSLQDILENQQDLRIYSLETCENIAREIAGFVHKGFSSEDIFSVLGSSLIFRDTQGVYWNIDPVILSWKKYDHGWIEAQQPAAPLEGAADLQAWLCATGSLDDAAFEKAEQACESESLEEPDSSGNPKEALAEIVKDTWQDYMAGIITSFSADLLLREYMIADKDAAFWTLGCRSGDWYRFNGEFWEKSAKPPSDNAIPQPEEIEQLTAGIKHTILAIIKSGASFLPEMVADEWTPPDLEIPSRKHDEEVVPDKPGLSCAHCNTALEDTQKFCISCGTKVTEKLAIPTCSGCGGEINEGLKFCTNCGKKL